MVLMWFNMKLIYFSTEHYPVLICLISVSTEHYVSNVILHDMQLHWHTRHYCTWLQEKHCYSDITWHYFWANYNDLTATSLGMMVSKGIIPKWPSFRLVKYCNLPRLLDIELKLWPDLGLWWALKWCFIHDFEENSLQFTQSWLVVSNMDFIFHFIYGIILPIDFHIFQDG